MDAASPEEEALLRGVAQKTGWSVQDTLVVGDGFSITDIPAPQRRVAIGGEFGWASKFGPNSDHSVMYKGLSFVSPMAAYTSQMYSK